MYFFRDRRHVNDVEVAGQWDDDGLVLDILTAPGWWQSPQSWRMQVCSWRICSSVWWCCLGQTSDCPDLQSTRQVSSTSELHLDGRTIISPQDSPQSWPDPTPSPGHPPTWLEAPAWWWSGWSSSSSQWSSVCDRLDINEKLWSNLSFWLFPT